MRMLGTRRLRHARKAGASAVCQSLRCRRSARQSGSTPRASSAAARLRRPKRMSFVGEVAGLVAVGRAATIVEIRTQQDVDRQAVGGLDEADVAGRDAVLARGLRDDRDLVELLDDLPIAWNQDADVEVLAQRPRERRRDFAEAAGLEEIRHLRGGEQHLRLQRSTCRFGGLESSGALGGGGRFVGQRSDRRRNTHGQAPCPRALHRSDRRRCGLHLSRQRVIPRSVPVRCTITGRFRITSKNRSLSFKDRGECCIAASRRSRGRRVIESPPPRATMVRREEPRAAHRPRISASDPASAKPPSVAVSPTRPPDVESKIRQGSSDTRVMQASCPKLRTIRRRSAPWARS